MHMQQVQPALSMLVMQSQHAWIISPQALSPLVQVTHTPASVISHLHMPMVRLQVKTIMPFIIMQQLHIPPASILQRFCTMLEAILSSQLHVIFIPPVHFSILNVHRGTMRKLAGMEEGDIIPGIPIPVVPTPGMPIPARSINMLTIASTPLQSRGGVIHPRHHKQNATSITSLFCAKFHPC
jgi:hypothetical protein